MLALGALIASIAGSSIGNAVAMPNLTIGSVTCALDQYNPTHFKLQVGTSATCTISASLVGNPSTVNVYVKSTPLGNVTVTGTVSGSTITFTYTAPLNGCETTNISYDNGAGTQTNAHAGFGFVDASGNPIATCGGETIPPADLTVTKTAVPSYSKTYAWGIAKSVDHASITDPSGKATFNYGVAVTHDSGTAGGWKATGTITVTNPNTVDVTGVTVTDAISNGGTCTVSGGTNITVPASDSVDLAYTCTYGSAPSPASGTNTATATWTADGSPHTSATGTATVDFGAVSPTVVDGCVSVTDTVAGALGTVCSTDSSPKTYLYTHQVTGTAGTCVTQPNTATYTTDTTETTGSASKSVQLCTPADLMVSKTASAAFKRTYLWKIEKSVDQSSFTGGGTAHYTVTASQTGVTDGLWTATGSITVHNPNDFEAISLTGVTDAIDNGGTCAITSGNPSASVAAGTSVVLGYICTYASAPSPASFTNTATATWDKAAASTQNGSAHGTATGSFGDPSSTVNKTVTVSDSFAGSLGTVTAADSAPFTVKTFTYPRTLTAPASGCATVDNTATIVETGQQASQSVQNCAATTPPTNPPTTPTNPPTGGGGSSNPAISIVKSPKSQTVQSGGTATFTITVTNTGNVTLSNVTVTDQLSPDCNKTSAAIPGLASMATGAAVTYNCSQANVTAGFTNVAVATGTPPSGANVSATDSANVAVRAPAKPQPQPVPTHPSISIVKGPNSQTISEGGTATFTITVKNTGDVTLSSVKVADPLSPGCDHAFATLAVGESKSYTCTEKNVAKGFENVATATGKPPTGAVVKASDHADVKVVPFLPPKHPSIAIVKSPKVQTLTARMMIKNTPSGSHTTVSYPTAHFKIKVTNNGNVALHGVKVADPSSPSCDRRIGSLAVGHSHTYTCTRATVSRSFTNLATASGVSSSGAHVKASDHARVHVHVKTTSTSPAKFTG
jgi:uncharacterized repeat protein (TIGR01451 family)